MDAAHIFFAVYYILNVIGFAATLVFAVSKLRKPSVTQNTHISPFVYFSFTAWVLGAFQYVILIASLFSSSPSEFLRDTGLWLGFMQNALWGTAILSYYSEQFSRVSETSSSLEIFLIVIAFALLTYRTPVLTSEIFTLIDNVVAAIIFMTVAIWLWQRRLSNKLAAIFFIYGYSQWIWRSLGFTPLAGAQFALLFAWPLWRLAILFAWIRMISVMLSSAQPSSTEVVEDSEHVAPPDVPDDMPVQSDTNSQRRGITLSAKPVLVIIVSVLLTIALRAFIVRELPAVVAVWNDWWSTTIGTIIIALCGWVLFIFRKHNQTLYGATEIGFALPIIWINLGKLQKAPEAPALIAVVTALYLIVRGFINWEEGNKKSASD